MDCWEGRVALVTGASSGIGAAIAKDLVQQGMKVVGVARNVQKIQELSEQLKGSKGSLLAIKCDLTKDQDIYDVFKTIKDTVGGVDVCINNAGLLYYSSLLDGTPDEWRSMMDVNVISLCLCTKLSVASMKERGIDDGHVINISSVCGHIVPPVPTAHFYTATKFAINAITEGLRQELRAAKSHIRASTISPGLVKTELSRGFCNDNEKGGDPLCLMPEDISAAVLHALSAPPHVEINDILMRSTEHEL